MTSHLSPSSLPSSLEAHDDIKAMDIIKATRKPTKRDHFLALLQHNYKTTLRDPSVFVFGAALPFIMIGIAIGISLAIQSNIPKVVAGMIDTRTFSTAETGIQDAWKYVDRPVVYFPVIKSVPSLNNLTDSVVINLQRVYGQFNPVFVDYASMDDVAAYEHQNAKDMLKNRTLKDYEPQLGFEMDALALSTTNGAASLDLGFTIATKINDSIPFLLTTVNALTQNVDANSGSNGGTAGQGLRFLPTLKTFGAQGNENVDIPSFIVPAFMTFAFSFFITFVASNLVTEKENGQKAHLQNMGIKPSIYYLARFVIDWICYLIPVVASFILMGAARLQMITSGSWVPYFLLLLVSGFPFITFGYLLSLFFQKSQTVGQVLGVGLSIVVFVPYFFVQFVFGGASILAIVLIGILSPSFALERSLSALAIAQTTGDPFTVGDTFNIKYAPFPSMILFVCQSVVYLILIFWIENLIQTRRTPIDFFFRRGGADLNQSQFATKNDTLQRRETSVSVDGRYRERDAEVVEETLRLRDKQSTLDESDAVRLFGLSKKFYLKSKKRDQVILDDIYLSFKKNECFGYLGPNGAGKTTTIKILTGAEGPTSGNGTIEGLPIAPYHEDLRSMIGICPQFDVLWPKLSCRDHLELFAKIKGVAPKDLDAAVTQMINEMGLADLGNKRAKTLSGGNKRRLSLAMAVIGCPKVVFLDEPTTGVDVSIRQLIWNSIRKLKKTSCVILTTHSMEEADALCDRIGIITNGHIQALGTSQRLKNTYGAGYKVIVKTHDGGASQAITAALEHAVGTGRITLVQALGASLEYEITRAENERTTEMLAKLFRLFEQQRLELGVDDYSVSQTTLAQVFIEFAKEQAAPEDLKQK